MSRLDETRTENTRDDYETPESVLVRVREVFGGQIDLDPCTSERNPTGANVCFTRDGLTEDWAVRKDDQPIGYRGYRNAFVNPPYGSALSAWAAKVVSAAAYGLEIITLTPARPDTRWYDRLVSSADLHADIRGRLIFNREGRPVLGKNGKPQTCQFPCTLTYFGLRSDRFADVMSRSGFARILEVVR